MNLTEYEPHCRKLAQQWGVSPAIHPEDYIFQFIINHPSYQSDKEQAVSYYFNDGFSSAEKLKAILSDVCDMRDRAIALLEFASGYGCVTRHIKNVMPLCSVTSCDIHPQAVKFLNDEFGVATILSHSVPEQIFHDGKFDVVFALSFFSHMPKDTFARWLLKLASFVAPGGFLIFTTHGMVSRRLHIKNRGFDSDGFFFLSASEQKDINPSEYGCAVVLPSYIANITKDVNDLSLKYFHEGYWWGHQDVYVFEKMAGTDGSLESPSVVNNIKTEFSSKLSYLRWKVMSRFT